MGLKIGDETFYGVNMICVTFSKVAGLLITKMVTIYKYNIQDDGHELFVKYLCLRTKSRLA